MQEHILLLVLILGVMDGTEENLQLLTHLVLSQLFLSLPVQKIQLILKSLEDLLQQAVTMSRVLVVQMLQHVTMMIQRL